MKTGLLIVFLLILPFTILADHQTFTISGKVYFSHKKPIHIFLVDEKTSKKPFAGIYSLVITPDTKDAANGYVTYKFTNVKQGIYGIRCFQDMNDNKKLDRGLFGPGEPWGLSWNREKTSNWPSFKNFCFTVKNNTSSIDIKLNN